MSKDYDHKANARSYWLFSIIFLIVGIGVIFLTWRNVSSNYLPAKATITDSRIIDRTQNGAIYGYLNLIYEYEAGNKLQRWRNSAYSVAKGTSQYDGFIDTVQSHPKGSVVQIHYNPRYPATPIFDGIPLNAYLPPAIFGVVFVLIGIGLLYTGFRVQKEPVADNVPRVKKIHDGEFVLSASDATGVNIGWKMGFAVIWNLFVVAAIIFAVIEKPNLSWPIIAFFGLFLLGGIIVFHQYIIANIMAGRCFEQPLLIASRMPLKRGDVFEIRYHQSTKKRLIVESVLVRLQCYSYKRVGRIEDHRKLRKTLFSEERRIELDREIGSGMEFDFKQELMIPTDAPPSSEDTDLQQVIWMLEFQVATRKAIDFQAEYTFEVNA